MTRVICRAFAAVNGLHHELEHGMRIFRLLGRRALEVGEEHGDLFALAFTGGLRRKDLCGEVLGSV